MIVGFLGKGGSGKTTLSTLFTKHLLDEGKKVLAIDADHNMDFSFNLGANSESKYFGKSMSEIKKYVGANPDTMLHYRSIFTDGPKKRFSLFPHDEFTANFVNDVDTNLSLLIAGPHVDEIWEGNKCSHSLFTMLKIYLPYLDLKSEEYVVVDEKAGMDPVGTLVPAGFDVAVIAVEPTVHAIKTANQIAEGLLKYKTPYVFVGNKVNKDEHQNLLDSSLSKKTIVSFGLDVESTSLADQEFKLSDHIKNNFINLHNELKNIVSVSEKREARVTRYWKD